MGKKKKIANVTPEDENKLKEKVAKAKKKEVVKEEPKENHVEVPCPRCNKIVEVCLCDGRYKTCIGPKQISGKASNPDFPCPFCNNRLTMPTCEK